MEEQGTEEAGKAPFRSTGNMCWGNIILPLLVGIPRGGKSLEEGVMFLYSERLFYYTKYD